MTWIAAGVASAAVTAEVYSQFSGKKESKKRQAALAKKIADIKDKIAKSMRARGKEADDLFNAQVDFADQNFQDAMDYYSEMKIKFNALFERNAEAAEEQFGEQLRLVETALQEELGLTEDMFTELSTELDSIYEAERDFIQADIAYNTELKEEFKTDADEAIKTTWENTEGAKVDLDNLQGAGGRPESFDRAVADQSKAFHDIKTEIDRDDAGRGKTDLTGKKLTAQFAEAVARGKLSGQMGEQGQLQKERLRNEITAGGNLAMQQSLARSQGAATDDGAQMAALVDKFGNQRMNNIYNEGMQQLGKITDANEQERVYNDMMNQTINELARARDAGEISMEEFKFLQQEATNVYKIGAKEQNVQYHQNLRKENEQMMGAGLVSLQSQVQPVKEMDWGKVVSTGTEAFMAVKGGGGFGGGGGGGGGNSGGGTKKPILAYGEPQGEPEARTGNDRFRLGGY